MIYTTMTSFYTFLEIRVTEFINNFQKLYGHDMIMDILLIFSVQMLKLVKTKKQSTTQKLVMVIVNEYQFCFEMKHHNFCCKQIIIMVPNKKKIIKLFVEKLSR